MAQAIAPRNVAGLASPERRHLYPVDFDALIDSHALLGMSRHDLVEALPALRGMSPPPQFIDRGHALRHDLAATSPQSP
jgi:hypothetical protein